MLEAYGVYLAGGGTPEGFETLSERDIQIMYTVYRGGEVRRRNELIKEFNRMLTATFGGEDDGGY